MKIIKITLLIPLIVLTAGCKQKQTPGSDIKDTTKTDNTQTANKKVILFFGDSLTAGYGLDDESEAFPGVIQNKIDSLKLPYHVVNAGVSGETSAGGLARINWALKNKVNIFVLELGANDGLRGNSVKQTSDNLQAIITTVKTEYPAAKILLLGMQVPPSMGQAYAGGFKNIFPQLAKKNHIDLVPFLLADVGGNPKLNQADGIHPTAEGAKIVAGNVWKVLRDEL